MQARWGFGDKEKLRSGNGDDVASPPRYKRGSFVGGVLETGENRKL